MLSSKESMSISSETTHLSVQMRMIKALYEAALAEDRAKLDQLVAKGVNFEEIHAGIVHQLAADGKERAIELLVQTFGGDHVLELRDAAGSTPLLVAVQQGQANVVRKLLELGADVHAMTFSAGLTALHLVAEYGEPSSSLEILKTLLCYDAAQDLLKGGHIDGDTPLHLAAFKGDNQIVQEMTSALVKLNHPSGVDLKSLLGRTPLHYAASKGNLESAHILIHSGARKDEHDDHGATPFHFAARCGQTNILEILQPTSVNDPTTGTTKMTALHYAAYNGHDEVVKWLLEHQASTDVQDEIEGNTPLHWAARNGHASVVKSLMEGGANAMLTNKSGQLAIGLADEVEEEHRSAPQVKARGQADEAGKDHRNAARAIVSGITTRREDTIKGSLWTKHSRNGATLLHYFAGYGTAKELKWIISVIQNQPPPDIRLNDIEQEIINTKDNYKRNAVHWAAMKGNKDAISILAENNADLNAAAVLQDETPLSYAVINGDIEVADELLEWNLRNEDWLHNIRTWMPLFITNQRNKYPDIHERVEGLQASFDQHTKPSIYPQHVKRNYDFEIPPIYLALHIGREDMACFLQRHSRSVQGAVNEKGKDTRRTALHWATLLQERQIVAQLCRLVEEFAQALAADVEDVLGKTALQYAKEMELREIEKELLLRTDVIAYVEGMYRDRQVYVDAANAILVGSALISGVTFAGWLQPPLGYLPYSEYLIPGATGDDAYESFAGVKQHLGVRMFWLFNSLSFSFGIASMIACLLGVVPIPRIYIANTVQHLRRCLLTGSALLGLSIVFVLAAFGVAGFTVLPPSLKYSINMIATTIVGGVLCMVLLVLFACRLWSIRPRWLKGIEKKVMGKQICAPPPQKQLSRKYSSTHIRRNPSNIPATPTEDLPDDPRHKNVPWEDGLDSMYLGQKATPSH